MLKVKIKCCLMFYSLVFGPNLNAQEIIDTSLLLDPIEISAQKKLSPDFGGTFQEWETTKVSAPNIQNLADLLHTKSNVYIKSYGQGGIATSSFQGGSAGQTTLLWNGMPIQNVSLGLSDLSLIPISAVDNIQIQKGGNSAMWGSGAIGGVISLNSEADFEKLFFIDLKSRFGQFGLFSQNLNIGFGNLKFQSRSKLFSLRANNNFPHYVAQNVPDRIQTNAAQKQIGFVQDLFWNLKDKNILTLHFWAQKMDRQFPPTIVQNKSLAHQNDESIKVIMDWKNIAKNQVRNLKVGLIKESLEYFDDQIGLYAPSDFTRLYGELSNQWQLNKFHHLRASTSYSHAEAGTEYYDDKIQENQIAFFTSWNYSKNNLQLSLNGRQAIVDENWIPFVPSFGFNYSLIEDLILKFQVSRSYRLPSLNDRYWNPGGNVNLIPESGWSQDVGMQYKFSQKDINYEFELNGFSKKINNWILWGKAPTENFFSANNLTGVWSRGLDLKVSAQRKINDAEIKIDASYAYTLSHNEVDIDIPKLSAGEQLPYTPVHKLFTSIAYHLKKISLSYNHLYNGSVSGFNEEVDAFHLADVMLSFEQELKKTRLELFIQVNNLWNNDYFIIERRPMPGINYQIGINLNFKK